MAKRKGAKRQTMLYKTLQRKLRIKQHEPYKNYWALHIPIFKVRWLDVQLWKFHESATYYHLVLTIRDIC
jgi:hypothetical protein